jgi:chorismate mutase
MTVPVDPVIAAFREEIAALDVGLIETLNTRVEKVRALRRYKDEHGIAFLDPGREAWLTEHLQQSNRGPLSPTAVAEVCEFVLALVKRELADD